MFQPSYYLLKNQESKKEKNLRKIHFSILSFMLNCVNAAHATHILGKGNYIEKRLCVYKNADDDESLLIEKKKSSAKSALV